MGFNLGRFVDQISRGAHTLGQLPQAVGVGTVGGTDNQHQVAVTGQLLDGILAVLGGVADVVFAGAFDFREFGAQGVDHPGGVVHGEGGLGDVGEAAGVFDFQLLYVGLVFHQVDIAAVAAVVLAHGAFYFRVAVVADEDALASVAAVAHDFQVHFGDQRAGGVEYFQASAGGFVLYGLGYAVGAEDHQLVVWHFMQFVDKDRPAVAEVVDDEFVVDDFVAYVDGGAEYVEGAVYDFYGAVYAGTEASGVSESDLHHLAFGVSAWWSWSPACAGRCFQRHAVNTSMYA